MYSGKIKSIKKIRAFICTSIMLCQGWVPNAPFQHYFTF